MNSLPHLEAEAGEFYVELSPESPPFPAIIDHRRTGGWARPRFRRPVAEALLAWLSKGHDQGGRQLGTGYIDGGRVVLVDADNNWSLVSPDSDGRVPLGCGQWPWFISAPVGDAEAEAALLADAARLTPKDGEQLVTITIVGDNPSFPAKVDDERWNGWASPHFRRPVAEVVVAWINQTYRDFPDGSARAYWQGDTVVMVNPFNIQDNGYTPTRVPPDADGRYCIGGWDWTWEFADRGAAASDQLIESDGDR